MELKRGDIYYANLNPRIGYEQGGIRPVVILQNNKGNLYSPTVIVAVITSRDKKDLPVHVSLIPGQENGLAVDSKVLLEQVRTLDKERLGTYVGHLSDEDMQKIDKALSISLALEQPQLVHQRACLFCRAGECEHTELILDRQEKILREYCKRNEIDIIQVFRNVGEAFRWRKDFLQPVFRAAQNKEYDILLVPDFNRLCSSSYTLQQIALNLNQFNVTVMNPWGETCLGEMIEPEMAL